MRRTLLLSLLVPAAAACTDSPVQTTQDTPIAVAASGDRVVVAATEETETTGFGCGGGGGSYGPSVLFVSGDRGTTFERIVPADTRPLTHIVSRDGVFYATAHSDEGGFAVVTSADGQTWTEVATGTRNADDLSITDTAIVVAHSKGVLVSTDGSTWIDHDLTDDAYGFYQARAAIVGTTIAMADGADAKLRLSSDGETWRNYTVPGFSGISQLIATGDRLLVTGYTASGGQVAQIDPANLTAAPLIRSGFTGNVVLTPVGLLDISSGKLATLDANGVGLPVDHLSPFHAAAVDAEEVVVLRAGSLETSTDGGLTFGAANALPLVRTETPIED